MSGDELDRKLEGLRSATDALAPDERISDAILEAATGDRRDDPLARIARATSAIEAAPEIGDAIMARIAGAKIEARSSANDAAGAAPVVAIDGARAARGKTRSTPPSWAEGVGRAGPVAVGLALVAAAASFLFFVSSQRAVDDAVVSSVDSVEVLE